MIRMMKIRAALICAVVLQSVAAKEQCKAIFFDGAPHVKELLKADVYHPSSLAVEDESDSLYFSYLQLYYLEFRTIKLDLKTKTYQRIDINAGSAITVDQKRHLVYIGGAKGLYEYDSSSNKSHLILSTDVWRLMFREVLYYIEFISYSVHKYIDGESTPFDELVGIKVYYFAVYDNYVVYSNATGIYGKDFGRREVLLKEIKNVDKVKEITLDRKGRFYVLCPDGIYKLDRFKESLVKAADVTEAYGMTFDAKNHLIYAKETSIFRLLPNTNCEYLA